MSDIYDTIKPRELGEFLREENRIRLAELESETAERHARMARLVRLEAIRREC